VTGDTDAKLECVRVHCDLLFIPVGGTYTFDARAAAKVANEIHPAVAVPIHYGQVVGNRADAEKFCSLLDDSIAGEILL
jgi:L-ascorbate metabolism protein UlaG (beta-lactamase superfamily)